MTEAEYTAELERLHAFTMRLAEHLYLAAEVIGARAERSLRLCKRCKEPYTPKPHRRHPDLCGRCAQHKGRRFLFPVKAE